MISRYYEQFIKFRQFLGKEVWRYFVISIFIGLLWFLVESSFIFVIQGFLRAIGILKASDAILPPYFPTSTVGSLLVLLGFGLLRAFASMLRQYFADATNQAFVRTQRERILVYSLSHTENVSSHVVINMFNEKVIVAAGLIQFLSTLILTLVSTSLFFLLGLRIAHKELILGVLLLVFFFVLLKFLDRKFIDFGVKLSNESRRLIQILMLGMKNHFLLKVYDLTGKEVQKGKTAIKNYEYFYKRFIFLSSIKGAFPLLTGSIVISVICFVSIEYIKTPGVLLLSFIYIFMRLAQSMSDISLALANIKFNSKTFKELYDWQLTSGHGTKVPEVAVPAVDQNFSRNLKANGVTLKIDNIHFKYSSGPELFSGLTFAVSKGEVLLLKGHSGSGKSTLLTLLLGLQKPTSGSILVNGTNVSEKRTSLAPLVSYVGPEPYMIEGTVKENLMYGNMRNEIDDGELLSALKDAQLANVFSFSNDGLSKNLKEVTELSTGQKQRMAIARALLRNPKLLILDEATANLDAKLEKEIVDMVNDLATQMTIVIISHKDSFDRIATKVIDLEK